MADPLAGDWEGSLEKIYTVGGRRLEGEVILSGSKNATLAIMSAALLPEEGQTLLKNVPEISDVQIMGTLLEHMGVSARFTSNNVLRIDATNVQSHEAPYELIKKMRASFSVLGPILARFGKAKVALPGGCDIGARPVDFHLKGLEQMGAEIVVEHGFVDATAPSGLQGAQICLEFPSVGATTHLMAAAALARGKTTIVNAAEEPDVVSCAAFINAMGGKVQGAGTKTIEIEGVDKLTGTAFEMDSDRIEAGTFAVAALITGGDLFLRNAIEEHLQPVISKLAEAGAVVEREAAGIRVRYKARPKAIRLMASPHPGFPTDLQPVFASLLATAKGTSVITETVYERRFKYIDELNRMGGNLKVEGNAAIIHGVNRLTGAPVAGSDLRATAALVLAGLAAEGQSEVSGVQYLDRGYENLVGKLAQVGADIWRGDQVAAPKRIEEKRVQAGVLRSAADNDKKTDQTKKQWI
ncbi:MAG TPA: UDP-N-acetylglucosamine 1-carboxyvinyltransferase [Capsulimonadaceae bacterium]|nr:UDP-N-acetylglucosamine 1-carboxyvinyltransferase [Capsulimonadaceae bacterium]